MKKIAGILHTPAVILHESWHVQQNIWHWRIRPSLCHNDRWWIPCQILKKIRLTKKVLNKNKSLPIDGKVGDSGDVEDDSDDVEDDRDDAEDDIDEVEDDSDAVEDGSDERLEMWMRLVLMRK